MIDAEVPTSMPRAPSLFLRPVVAVTLLATACTPVLHSPDDQDDTGSDIWVAPENTWPSAMPPDDLEGTGFATGEVPPDFRLPDQFGDTVSLWQFYGLVVVVDVSTMWCAPCQEIASGVEDTYQHYKDQGFVYLTVLPQNLDGEVPTGDDLEDWADYYGISAPILADSTSWTYDVVPDKSYPRLLVIGRDLRVADAEVTPTTDSAVRDAVEQEL
jgi:peroxiredoxin